MVESDEIIRKDFNIDRDSIPLEEQKKNLMSLLKKDLLDLRIYKKVINLDNLIYKYKTEAISPNDIRNYQTPIQLFKDLRDDNINREQVLKDQINFK